MTKKTLLKWLDTQKTAALDAITKQEKEAKQRLLDWKIEASNFSEFVEYVSVRLNEVYDYTKAWHEKYVDICGKNPMAYGNLQTTLCNHVSAAEGIEHHLRRYEIYRTQKDEELEKKYNNLRAEVRRTYDDVMANVQTFTNAKLGMAYLEDLGFDLTQLKASDEKPVETALARPIDRRYLFIHTEE